MASVQAHEHFLAAEHLPGSIGLIINKDSPRTRIQALCFASYEPGPTSQAPLDMGSSRRFSINQGQSARAQHSVKQSLCDAVVKQVIQRVRSFGYSEAVCEELHGHFERLPSR
jgi:hypothetical protein